MIPTRRIALAAATLATAGVALVGSASSGQAAAGKHTDPVPGGVPAALEVPDGNRPVAVLAARGVQTYTCTAGAWTLLEPAATLWKARDVTRRPVALHSRGPVWVSVRDGSAVNGSAVASSPRPGAVPELLIKATANRGDGLFGDVTYIQRLRTHGGLAPAGPCDGAEQTSVRYSATYVFHAPKG